MTLLRRIDVPADLDSVTTVGAEVESAIDVDRIWRAVSDWYRVGVNPAIQLCLRVNGDVVLNRSIGHAFGNGPQDPPHAEQVVVTPETPYCVYSAAKGITSTVVHSLVERGVLDLEAPVSEYLPGYTSHGKDRTTLRHVLTHSAGVPFIDGEAMDLDQLGNSDFVVAKLCEQKQLFRPGMFSIYHAVTFGFLTREIVQAATGKSIRDILATEVLDPLGFRWTNYGVSPDDVPLVAPSHVTARDVPQPFASIFRKAIGGTLDDVIPLSNDPRFLTGVLPSSNTVSTADELSRFYEILRRGGELDGVRVLSPSTLLRALTPATRMRPDVSTGLKPLQWGLGFMMGGKRFGPFGRDTSQSFGHLGLINVAGWADPQRGLAGGLITSGKPGPHPDEKLFPALMNLIAAEVPDIPVAERPFTR